MANQYKNKVVYNGTTLIDLSDTTAVQSDVASGKIFYTASGERVVGTASGGGMTVTDVPNSTGTGSVISGEASVLGTKTITANGTYSASDDSADGYSSVTVNVSGGVSITDGMIITEWDTNGTRPKVVEIYGNVPSYMFGQYNNSSSLGINLTSVTFHNTEKIGYAAFQRAGLQSITIPDSVNSIGEQCFRGQTALAHYVHENARDLYGYNKPAVKALNYGLSHLEDMQLGAVGKPVTALYKDAFSNNQVPSTAVVTIYTTGDRVDTLLTAMRTYLTTQQIVFKASESTTYNGNSYSAGDTMLTSTPS